MDCGETSAAIRPAQRAAPLAREDHRPTNESASRDGAKGNDEPRIDQRLTVEPPAALLHLSSSHRNTAKAAHSFTPQAERNGAKQRVAI
jgi:hypothetical protein